MKIDWLRVAVLLMCWLVFSFMISGYSESFMWLVEQETEKIKQASQEDSLFLADAYASRGETYLLMRCFNEAVSDFSTAYEYASTSEEDEEGKLCVLRILMDGFLAYALLDDVEKAEELFHRVSAMLTACSSCVRTTVVNTQPFFIQRCAYRKEPEPDYPILGPDYTTMKECAKRVENTAKELKLLCAAIPNTQVRALSIVLIDQLETEAVRCWWAGGLWKGCLQKLANKFHYWQLLGAPSDMDYYTGIHFM